MRILIDALAARYGGTAYATIQLARHLSRNQDVESVSVLARRRSIVEQGLRNDPQPNCVVLAERSRMELLYRIAWEAARLPAVARRLGTDVLISMSGMLPRSPHCELVCLLFNPVMYENHGAANLARRWAVRRTCRQAICIVAPSRSMAALASASIGRDCAVIPLGVDHATFAPAADPGEDILCVADFYAHKRHDLILDIWQQLTPPRPRLHLVGNAEVDPRAYAGLLERIRKLSGAGRIAVDHGLSLNQLVAAYRSARVFLLTSEHESFCMPLLESMACGVPAVVRDLPSLRETGGAGARYVAENDPRPWSLEIQQLLADHTEHRRARDAAMKESSRHSWDAFATALTSGWSRARSRKAASASDPLGFA